MDLIHPEESLHHIAKEFTHQIRDIEARLQDVDDGGRALVFGRILLRRMARSVMQELDADTLAEGILRALDLLLGRTGDVAVCAVPRTTGGFELFVQCPDARFLFDALQNLLLAEGADFRVICHPLLQVDRQLEPVRIGPPTDAPGREWLSWYQLDGLTADEAQALAATAESIMSAIMCVNRDLEAMRARLQRLGESGLADCAPLCQWLLDDHFIPTSYRCLEQPDLDQQHGAVRLTPERLGLPTPLDTLLGGKERALDTLPEVLRQRLLRASPAVIEDLDERNPFHRLEQLTLLGFRESGEFGWREHLFQGFFSQKAQGVPTTAVPALRQRIDAMIQAVHIPVGSHDAVKILEIFDAFPKVETFLLDDRQLRLLVRSLPQVYRHEGVRLIPLPRLSPNRLTLVLILPKDYYDPERMQRVETYLGRHFQTDDVRSRVVHVSRSYISLHVHLWTSRLEEAIDTDKLGAALTRLAQPWDVVFRRQLELQGYSDAGLLRRRYARAFSEEYRTRTHPRFAVRDVRNIEAMLARGRDLFDLWGPFQEGVESSYRLQHYSSRRQNLNALMPLLENLLVSVADEIDSTLELDGATVYLKSFTVRYEHPGCQDMSLLRDNLLEAIDALHGGEVENDRLNMLLPLTGLGWRQIDLFRAYRSYYFQLGTPYTKRSVAFALVHNPQVAQLLYRYFEARFRPDPAGEDLQRREEQMLQPVRQELLATLEQVQDFSEDRILRAVFNLMDATVRTNFFRRVGRRDYFIALKISSLGVMEMPAPRPLYEIFVHGAGMEGIHLRGGKVARGGIRWSDRPDDFRTEILGLMKAQMTKNAVIVPVGAKGGFVVTTPWSDREQGQRLATEAYKTLMRGLLDLTDNRVGGQLQPAPEIVAYDEADPYLVVAADKGTAHLSDTANAVAAEYDFWLGDAFASGGSYGYDHKKLGITARGAWECVKRHFRELGTDIQQEPFTVVGIGDMSGDVFGNGMLLSPCIRLLAAFNHRHIFLDPDPDPAASFAERQRLFALPRSSWADYDATLISAGGGVFDRQAKRIPLSPQLRQWLGVRHESMDGPELIQTLLRAEVDLLWNGGIGTYVKSSEETHEQVGDRANDGVRIDADQLRARVVGEGGNLGFTQRARIEYALRGGRINTDALDNSAGVDCSDHEVNLKILLNHLQQAGGVTAEAVHSWVERVSDDVVALVLRDNIGQSLCLSLDQLRQQQDVEPLVGLMERLADSGLLDPAGEFLPSPKQLRARGTGFTRPELAVLLSYSKMFCYRQLLESPLLDDPGVQALLPQEFPSAIVETFGDRLAEHPLAREILATGITNRLLDQAGAAFWYRQVSNSGARLDQIIRHYLLFDRILDGPALRHALDAAADRLPVAQQYACRLALEGALDRWCGDALATGGGPDFTERSIADWRQQLTDYAGHLTAVLPAGAEEPVRALREQLTAVGIDEAPARLVAVLSQMGDMIPLLRIQQSVAVDLYAVLRTQAELSKLVGADRLMALMAQLPAADRWDRQAAAALQQQLRQLLTQLTAAVLRTADGNPEAYFGRHRAVWRAYRASLDGLDPTRVTSLHPVLVVLHGLQQLVTTG